MRIYGNSKDYLNYLNDLFKKELYTFGKITKDTRKNNTFWLTIKNAAVYHYFKILDAKYLSNNLPSFTKSKESLLKNYLSD